MVVLNKSDIVKLEELSPEKRGLLTPLEKDGIPFCEMSTVTDDGVMNVKQEVSAVTISKGVGSKICFLHLNRSEVTVIYSPFYPSICKDL